MKFSKETLDVIIGKELGLFNSNAKFWKIKSEENILEVIKSKSYYYRIKEDIIKILENDTQIEGVISCFDDEFPIINSNVSNSEKPYLLYYSGEISLLNNLNKNVAVIGLTHPSEGVQSREKDFVKRFGNQVNIVSGLAKGCDTIAHETCIENGGKTIAILPSSIKNIYPKENIFLVNKIIKTGGLVITEYFKDPKSKFEAIKRFIDRDRLQAMFSKAVIMICSNTPGRGNDSGSRHAMEYAMKMGINRYVLYRDGDSTNKEFDLNRLYLNQKKANLLKQSCIEEIIQVSNENLNKKIESRQLKMEL